MFFVVCGLLDCEYEVRRFSFFFNTSFHVYLVVFHHGHLRERNTKRADYSLNAKKYLAQLQKTMAHFFFIEMNHKFNSE